jgi:exodeoxyribonuclease-5
MLSLEQGKVYDEICRWINSDNRKPFHRMSGFAGTGKTFLLGYLVNNIDLNSIAVCAFTWKAALVLQSKGISQAASIHSTFYRLVSIQKKGMSFQLKPKEDINFELIIIDEASMVPKKMREEILSYGIPVLFVGDAGQLKPIANEKEKLFMEDAESQLTEVHRQALDSPIIRLSMDIRHGKRIPYGKYGESVFKVRPDDDGITTGLFLKSDQIICAKNDTRQILNNRVRKAMKLDTKMTPYPGEKIIVTHNNISRGLFNGMMLDIVAPPYGEHKPALLENSRYNEIFFERDPNLQIIDEFSSPAKIEKMKTYFVSKTLFPEIDPEASEEDQHKHLMLILKNENLIQCDFGYAVTCHKFQGSEADKVVVFYEPMRGMTKDDKIKWQYTAVTRAKKKLIFIE